MLDVRNRLGSFFLGPRERLYTDEAGRRVVFAAEERVVLAVMSGGLGGFQTCEWPQGGALTSDAEVFGLAVFGPPPGPEAPEAAHAAGTVTGCGWILPGTEVRRIDDMVVQNTAPIALPFWQSCEVKGMVQVTSPVAWLRLCRVGCTDAESRHSAAFHVAGESSAYAFEGRDYRFHLGAATLTFDAPSGCRGLRLSKEYDRMQGRQRARVWVDGEMVGVWSAYEESTTARLGVSEFRIACVHLTAGPHVVAIDPPAGSPLWNWHAYQIEALT